MQPRMPNMHLNYMPYNELPSFCKKVIQKKRCQDVAKPSLLTTGYGWIRYRLDRPSDQSFEQSNRRLEFFAGTQAT